MDEFLAFLNALNWPGAVFLSVATIVAAILLVWLLTLLLSD